MKGSKLLSITAIDPGSLLQVCIPHDYTSIPELPWMSNCIRAETAHEVLDEIYL